MKKTLSLLLSLIMIISSFSMVAFAEDEISIMINGQKLVTDQNPIIVEGRTLVPVRAIFEGLGAVVTWDDLSKTATGVRNGKEIKITINSTTAYVDGVATVLDVPAQIVNSRTLVPVRFISEALGEKVDWDGTARTVIITSQNATDSAFLDLTFDNMESLNVNKDFIGGGAYKTDNITLSSDFDHTKGNGKSVKMANRTAVAHRLKLCNANMGMTLGEEYIVSAYVYLLEDTTTFGMGMYSDVGTTYAANPFVRKRFEIPANTWTKVELEFKYTDESVSQIGFDQTNSDAKVLPLIYIDDVKVTPKNPKQQPQVVPVVPTTPQNPSNEQVSTNGFSVNFDNLTSFTADKDFAVGGVYKAENISLSSDFDHTSGSGKSVKMADRTAVSSRLKIPCTMTMEIGKEYIATAYIYATEDIPSLGFGMYGVKGTTYAAKPFARKKFDIPANTWTKVELTFKYTDAEVSQIGIDQIDTKTKVVPTIYVDDVSIELKGKQSSTPSTAHKTVNLNDIPVTLREGKRPTPEVKNVGKTYDDLIFYERTFEEKEIKKNSEEMFNALPKDAKVLRNNDDMLNATLTGEEYTTIEKIDVEGMPFTKAIRATVKTVPNYSYGTQLTIPSMNVDDFEDGDSMLAVFYMRTIDVFNEFGEGKVQLIVEQEGYPNDKALKEDVVTFVGNEWKKVYLPFEGKKGYTRVNIRLGFYAQTVEFGGYQILNYGKNVKFEDLPSDTVAVQYDGRDIFDKNVQWRKDAWERIEQIRKGDINVIVKDAAGNIIPNADVKVDMYDHEFVWGSATGGNLLNDSEYALSYQKAFSMMFNGAVSEVAHKMAKYFSNPEESQSIVDAAKKMGLKYYRGHVLVVDGNVNRMCYDAEGNYLSNTTHTEELAKLKLNEDKAGLDAYYENAIKKLVSETKGNFIDWDVINEEVSNQVMYKKYGVEETIKKWYAWAKEADPDVKLYYNETKIVGDHANQALKNMKLLLDDMVSAGVQFDGIGVESHMGKMVASPYDYYQELLEIAKYGKEMKVTEFDVSGRFDKDGNDLYDEEFEASYTRDIMLLVYSLENMNGFLMWGFTDASHWLDNAPLFDQKWELKLSGQQYIDLVYNKWWTQEEGKTNADGTFKTKGYYGDYLITASANGKSKTVDIKHYKGKTNTIEIVLD